VNHKDSTTDTLSGIKSPKLRAVVRALSAACVLWFLLLTVHMSVRRRYELRRKPHVYRTTPLEWKHARASTGLTHYNGLLIVCRGAPHCCAVLCCAVVRLCTETPFIATDQPRHDTPPFSTFGRKRNSVPLQQVIDTILRSRNVQASGRQGMSHGAQKAGAMPALVFADRQPVSLSHSASIGVHRKDL